MTTIVLVILIVLSFFLLRPILMSIIAGLILAFIFYPIYCRLNNKIKSENLSAGLMCFLLISLLILPLLFLIPLVVDQSIKIYMASQEINFAELIEGIFPSLFASEDFSKEIGSVTSSFVTKITNYLMNSLSEMILNFPTLFLQSLVVFFTFFFVLRDKDKIISYIKSLSPFSKEIEKKLFDSSRAITNSVIYGQFVIGTLQGLLVGVGFFILGISNALILTLLACLAGIFPVIGTAVVWVPVAIYLLVTGDAFSAIGIVIFGLVSSSLDNFLRPIIISRRTHMNSLLILIGMIGGLFLFGILGFILGPLVLAYLLIILELYRNKKVSDILIQESKIKC